MYKPMQEIFISGTFKFDMVRTFHTCSSLMKEKSSLVDRPCHSPIQFTRQFNQLTTNFPNYRKQSIDLLCKSIDLFLCDGEHWSLMGWNTPKKKGYRICLNIFTVAEQIKSDCSRMKNVLKNTNKCYLATNTYH